ACVGLRGARVKNIVRELNTEKVDIIRWSDDIRSLVTEALKPAEIKSITGVYKREIAAMSGKAEKLQALIEAFEEAEGRRPRILVAKIGQDGHDRGQKVIASAFADIGFDVDIGPLFATADEAARQAVENDVHILGVSSLAAAHLTAVPELK
ncbi:cobalamin-dependent protein, partial [Bradyrhizobium sp.]|uniref:cobalamin-dependent protein n=1 Tax=Bradyrhizobium sp. TaxID=376 RepID=UPI00391A21C3